MNPQTIKAIIAKKIQGKWEPAHDETGHHYRHVRTGRMVDSVSTKLIFDRPHLKRYAVYEALRYMRKVWPEVHAGNEAEHFEAAFQKHTDARDDAGNVGTRIHAAIEAYVNEWMSTDVRPADIRTFLKAGEIDARVVAGARSAEKIFTETGAIPLASEIIVGDLAMKCAGTLDMLVWLDGELVLWDWKSSNQIDKNGYPLQVAGGYMKMFEKMTKLKIAKCIVIHLSKDYDKSTQHIVVNPELAYKAYRKLSNFYDLWWKIPDDQKIQRLIKRAEFIKLT